MLKTIYYFYETKIFGQKIIFSRFHVDKLSSAHVYLRLKEGTGQMK